MSYPAATTLQQAISSGATSITPVSLAGLTAPCYLVIDQEIVYCPTAPAGGAFTGVTRGALGTIAAAHTQYAAVYGLFSDLFPFSADGEFLNAAAAELATIETRLATPGGGAVDSVTGSAPITSTGGANPDIGVTVATDADVGVVKPDGTTIAVAGDGTLSTIGGGGGPTSISANLAGAGRDLNTVYQNTGSTPLFVTATNIIFAVSSIIGAITDTIDGNTTTVQQTSEATGVAAGISLSVFFIVLPGYFYQVSDFGSATGLLFWFEWA